MATKKRKEIESFDQIVERFSDAPSQTSSEPRSWGGDIAPFSGKTGTFDSFDDIMSKFTDSMTVRPEASPVTKKLLDTPLPSTFKFPSIIQPTSLTDAQKQFQLADKALSDYMASDEYKRHYINATYRDEAGNYRTRESDREKELKSERAKWERQSNIDTYNATLKKYMDAYGSMDDNAKAYVEMYDTAYWTSAKKDPIAKRMLEYYGEDGMKGLHNAWVKAKNAERTTAVSNFGKKAAQAVDDFKDDHAILGGAATIGLDALAVLSDAVVNPFISAVMAPERKIENYLDKEYPIADPNHAGNLLNALTGAYKGERSAQIAGTDEKSIKEREQALKEYNALSKSEKELLEQYWNDSWYEWVSDEDVKDGMKKDPKQLLEEKYGEKKLRAMYEAKDEQMLTLGKIESTLYSAAMSSAQSTAGVLTYGPLYTAGMGASEYQSSVSEYSRQGISTAKAEVASTLNAVIEGFTESKTVGRLEDAFFGSGNGLISAFNGEGFEEALGDCLKTAMEGVVLGYDSQLNQSVQEYVDQGMSREEAQKKTAIDFVKDTGYDYLVGGLSGMMGEATGAGYRAAVESAYSRAVNKAAESAFSEGKQETRTENVQQNEVSHEQAQTAQDAPIAPEPITAAPAQEKPVQTVDAPVRADVQETQTETQDIAPLPETKNAPAQDVTEAKAGQEIEDTGIELEKDFKDYPYDKQKVIKGYEDSTDQNILDFIAKHDRGETRNGEKIVVGTVSDKMSTDIESETGVSGKSGTKIYFNTSALEHIQKRHGEHGKHDFSMSNNEDIARINFVLQNYDGCGDVETSTSFLNKDGTPSKSLKFWKKINGTYFVVEAVPDSSKTWIVSAFMNKNGVDQTFNATESDPNSTSENASKSTPNGAVQVLDASSEAPSGNVQNVGASAPNEGTYVPNDQTVHGQESLTGDVQNEHTYSSTDSVDDIAPVVKQDKVETSTENDIAPIGENAEKNDSQKDFAPAEEQNASKTSAENDSGYNLNLKELSDDGKTATFDGGYFTVSRTETRNGSYYDVTVSTKFGLSKSFTCPAKDSIFDISVKRAVNQIFGADNAKPVTKGIIAGDDYHSSGESTSDSSNTIAAEVSAHMNAVKKAQAEAKAKAAEAVQKGDYEDAKYYLLDVKNSIAEENGVAKPTASDTSVVDNSERIANIVSAVVAKDSDVDGKSNVVYKADGMTIERIYNEEKDTYEVFVTDRDMNTYSGEIPPDQALFYGEVANGLDQLLSQVAEDDTIELSGVQESEARDRIERVMVELREQDKRRIDRDFKEAMLSAKSDEEKAALQKSHDNGHDGLAVKAKYSLPGYSVYRNISRDGEHYEVSIYSRDGVSERFSIPRGNTQFFSEVETHLLDMERQRIALKEAQHARAEIQSELNRALRFGEHMNAEKKAQAEAKVDIGPVASSAKNTEANAKSTTIDAPIGDNVKTNKAEAKKVTVAEAPLAVDLSEDGAELVKGKEKKAEPFDKGKPVRYTMSEEDYLASRKTKKSDKNTKPQSDIKRGRTSAWQFLKRFFVDKGAVIEDIGNKTGNENLDPTYRAIVRSGAVAQNLVNHGNEVNGVRALADIYDDVNNAGMIDDFNEYLVHKLNVDATSLDRRGICADRPVLTGVAEADSQNIVSRYEAEHPEFTKWANDVYAYNQELMNQMVKAGLVNSKQAELMGQMYEHYVPVKRVGVDETYTATDDSKNVSAGQPVKRRTQSDKPIAPILETMFDRTFAVEHSIAMNNFGIELYKSTFPNYAEQLQNPWNMIFGNVTSVDAQQMQDSYDPALDFLYDGDTENPAMFTMYVNGERHSFQISDDVYMAVKPRNDLLSKTIPVLGDLNDFRRRSLTGWNPAFNLMRNPVKDAQEVLKNSKHPLQTYMAYGSAYQEIINEGTLYKEYRAAGGADVGHFLQSDVNHFNPAKGLDWIEAQHGLKQIQYVGQVIETAPRLAEYMVSRKNGATIEQAMLDAARVTVDFSSGGELTKFADRNGFTFLNASVQGAWQHVRNVREAKKAGVGGWLSLAARYAGPGIAASIINGMLWGDDDDYENLSEYVKDRYYILFKYGDGSFVRIPKGRTDATIISAIKETRKMLSGDDDADFKRFVDIFIENMAPNNPLNNNLLAPVVQTMRNKTWYGEDIVTNRLSKLPKHEQYDEKTDDGSIALAQWLNEKWDIEVSPKRLNYFITNTTGVIGDTILPYFTQKSNVNSDNPLANLIAPLKDVFTVDGVLQDKNQDVYFDTVDEIKAKANSENATAEDKLRSAYLSEYSSKLSDLYTKQRNIQMDRSLKNSEKYTKAKEVRKKINALQKEALDGLKKKPSIDGKYAEFGGKRFDYNEQAGRWYTSEASDNAAKNSYYENEQAITKGYGISYSEYWNNKDKYDAIWYFAGKYREDERHIPVTTASTLFGMDNFARYAEAINKIPTGDDGKKWKTVQTYVDGLNLEPMEKQILMRIYYGDGERERNDWQKRKYSNESYDIVKWLDNNPSISDDEFWKIVDELGFYVDDNGKITW